MPITREEAKELFVPMAEKLRAIEWTDSDAFAWIGNFCTINVRVAYAFATVISQLLSETSGEVSYTDIMVAAYYNVLFDPEVSAKYGTGFLCESAYNLKQFVKTFDLNSDNPLPQITTLLLPPGIQ